MGEYEEMAGRFWSAAQAYLRAADIVREKDATPSMLFPCLQNIGHSLARKIVGWHVSTSAHAGFVLNALEQAVNERRPTKAMGLVHHSDRGS